MNAIAEKFQDGTFGAIYIFRKKNPVEFLPEVNRKLIFKDHKWNV